MGFVLPLGAALYLAREAAAQVASGTRGRNSFPYEQAVAQLSEFAVYWALAAVLCWLAAAAFRLWRRRRERHAAAIEFLGEQDGAPERELKTRLVRHVLPTYPVERAYLARTRMGNESGVTVCLRQATGEPAATARAVGAEFAGLFSAREHLDIVFLDGRQEADLSRVCPPFYHRAGGASA